MYEWVVILHPIFTVPVGPARDPCMHPWVAVMSRSGGGKVGHYWNATVEDWFNCNPKLILEFPYQGVDF